MKRFALLLTVVCCISCLSACNSADQETNPSNEEEVLFTDYKTVVSKDEFQKQYRQAYENLQSDYTGDFVYTYRNDYTERDESGEYTSTTNERTEYDSDSQIVQIHHQYQNNDPDSSANENYDWEYTLADGMLQFYDSRTNTIETRSFGFDEFWEFAYSRIPLTLFPNPYKLYDDKTYYIDLDRDGNTVFTLYSGDENDFSLQQIIFTGTEMIYRTKRYTKETDYEDTTIDVYHIYNENLTLTHISGKAE